MIVLCGKTAAGKDTIKKELLKLGFKNAVTYTTRPPRDGEENGIAYHFITEEEFLEKRNNDFFIESTSYNVASGETWYYGTPSNGYEDDTVIILNPEGLKAFRKKRVPNVIAFDILVDEETVWNRLRQRGDSAEEARRRWAADKEDFLDIDEHIDFAIKNNAEPHLIAERINWLYKDTQKEKSVNTIYLDFDGVICNTIETITELYNEDYSAYPGFKRIEWTDVETWDMEELSLATAEDVDRYFNVPRFFEKIKLMPNALIALDMLSTEYHIVVTSMGHAPNLALKEKWVKENIPYAEFYGIDIDKSDDKSGVNMSGSILIDDRGANLETSNASTKICFGDEYIWNKNWRGTWYKNWGELVVALMPVKQEGV